MALLDNLRRNLSQGMAPGQQAQAGATQQVQALAQAATGKADAMGAGAPQASRLGEQQALLTQQQQQRQLQTQGIAQAQQVKAAEQQQRQQLYVQRRSLEEREIGVKQRMLNDAMNMVQQLEQNKDEISFKRMQAGYEQMGFQLRLTNKDYIERLKIEGAKSRLRDKNRFEEQLQKTTWGHLNELLESDLEFQRVMNADERDFEREVAEWDLSKWREIKDFEAAQASAQRKYEAINQITGGVLQAGLSVVSAASSGSSSTASPGTGTPLQSAQNPMGPEAPIASQQGALQESWGLESQPSYSGPWRS